MTLLEGLALQHEAMTDTHIELDVRGAIPDVPLPAKIGLYRVLGMTADQVRRLVLMEGAFIGLLGGALAALLGAPLGYAAIGALRAVSAFDVTYHLPLRYVPLTILGAVVIAVGASLYPASRAARASSAESIHYE